MNKKVIKITTLHDGDEQVFWENKTYLERLTALEQLRRIMFGYDPSTARLQRTLTIAQLKED